MTREGAVQDARSVRPSLVEEIACIFSHVHAGIYADRRVLRFLQTHAYRFTDDIVTIAQFIVGNECRAAPVLARDINVAVVMLCNSCAERSPTFIDSMVSDGSALGGSGGSNSSLAELLLVGGRAAVNNWRRCLGDTDNVNSLKQCSERYYLCDNIVPPHFPAKLCAGTVGLSAGAKVFLSGIVTSLIESLCQHVCKSQIARIASEELDLSQPSALCLDAKTLDNSLSSFRFSFLFLYQGKPYAQPKFSSLNPFVSSDLNGMHDVAKASERRDGSYADFVDLLLFSLNESDFAKSKDIPIVASPKIHSVQLSQKLSALHSNNQYVADPSVASNLVLLVKHSGGLLLMPWMVLVVADLFHYSKLACGKNELRDEKHGGLANTLTSRLPIMSNRDILHLKALNSIDSFSFVSQYLTSQQQNVEGLFDEYFSDENTDCKQYCKELLRVGISLDVRRMDGKTMLMVAAERGNLSRLEPLVESGAKIDAVLEIVSADISSSQTLGERGRFEFDVCPTAHLAGWSALMFAIANDHNDCAQFLLSAGAQHYASASKSEASSLLCYQSRCAFDLAILCNKLSILLAMKPSKPIHPVQSIVEITLELGYRSMFDHFLSQLTKKHAIFPVEVLWVTSWFSGELMLSLLADGFSFSIETWVTCLYCSVCVGDFQRVKALFCVKNCASLVRAIFSDEWLGGVLGKVYNDFQFDMILDPLVANKLELYCDSTLLFADSVESDSENNLVSTMEQLKLLHLLNRSSFLKFDGLSVYRKFTPLMKTCEADASTLTQHMLDNVTITNIMLKNRFGQSATAVSTGESKQLLYSRLGLEVPLEPHSMPDIRDEHISNSLDTGNQSFPDGKNSTLVERYHDDQSPQAAGEVSDSSLSSIKSEDGFFNKSNASSRMAPQKVPNVKQFLALRQMNSADVSLDVDDSASQGNKSISTNWDFQQVEFEHLLEMQKTHAEQLEQFQEQYIERQSEGNDSQSFEHIDVYRRQYEQLRKMQENHMEQLRRLHERHRRFL